MTTWFDQFISATPKYYVLRVQQQSAPARYIASVRSTRWGVQLTYAKDHTNALRFSRRSEANGMITKLPAHIKEHVTLLEIKEKKS